MRITPRHKLRKETPRSYETYSDIVEDEWTKLKIVVNENTAELYVGDVNQPTLIVNDLNLDPDKIGKIGLLVGSGTEAYFSNLKVN